MVPYDSVLPSSITGRFTFFCFQFFHSMRHRQPYQTYAYHKSASSRPSRRLNTSIVHDLFKPFLIFFRPRKHVWILLIATLIIFITLRPVLLSFLLPSSSPHALYIAFRNYKPIPISAPSLPSTNYTHELGLLLRSASRLTQNPASSKKFILYRAIGNDLPPRHAKRQTVRNLRFILENEHPKPDLDVRWYLNRVVDHHTLLEIITLLVAHEQLFTIEFFDHSRYADVDFNLNAAPFKGTDVLRSSLFNESLETDFKRLRVWDTILEFKNQFIIRNNIARNSMIELGRTTNATYILPWDGNCFLTDIAWRNISTSITAFIDSGQSNVSTRYFYVPMTRTSDNIVLKKADFSPLEMNEEPQVILHRDAVTRFDETKPYGYRPKVDFLWRLRIPKFQFVDEHGNIMRDTQLHKLAKDIPEYDSVRPVGWTARLYSGNRALDKGNTAILRGRSRADGVELLAAKASLQVAQANAQYSHNTSLFMYNREIVLRRLDEISKSGTDSLTAQRVSKLVRHSYIITSVGDNANLEGSSKLCKITAHDLATVSLAALFSGDKRLLEWAAQRARQLMVEGETRIRVSDLVSPRDLLNICLLLDAVKLLNVAHGLSSLEFDAIQAWALEISLSLDEYSAKWKPVYFSQDVNSVLFEAGAGCVHAFAGNFHLAVRRLGLANGRLLVMAKDDESSFVEREGLHGLEAWVILAQMADRIGLNTWAFRDPNSQEAPLQALTRAILRVDSKIKQADMKQLHCLLRKLVSNNMVTVDSFECPVTETGENLPGDSIFPPFLSLALTE